ncbi:MAG: biotin--[acetyl-CoA-carboxylase] ligase [Clostridiales bacterium]|nr:biotin--[acetyl-CoA-carboxylase] ligase [Clostridiales bacterium]
MRRIIYYESVDSTNLKLKQLADTVPNGTAVIADCQTAGRGRLGRNWLSRPGDGACFSVLVKDNRLTSLNAEGLVFCCALAAADALRELSGKEILIKWPNDLILNGKKLCGILCESGFDGDKLKWTVCGIGINLNAESFPPELPYATSLRLETGLTYDSRQAAMDTLARFDRYTEMLYNDGLGKLTGLIAPISATLGREVRAIYAGTEIRGTAEKLLDDGSLLIRTAQGSVSVRSGEVSVRGLYGYI